MLTGQVLRARTLTTRSGLPVPMQVVRPDRTPLNIGELARTSTAWRTLAQRMGAKVGSHRVHLAADTAFLAADYVRTSGPNTHVLVAQRTPTGPGATNLTWEKTSPDLHREGDVLGVAIYTFDPAKQTWDWALQVTRPQDQPGYPNPDQIRGIGNELTGAGITHITQTLCAPITLECLDEQACRHWRNLGWHNHTEPLRLLCPDAQALAARLAHSERDDPARGELIEAIRPELLRRVSRLSYLR